MAPHEISLIMFFMLLIDILFRGILGIISHDPENTGRDSG
jgi:hypothetical protein